MKLRPSRYGQFYGCTRYPACQGTHGAHADGTPLGIPANRETKEARMAAHAAFDQLWQDGQMSRNRAYQVLRDLMGMTQEEAHIGRFTKEQCEQLIGKLAEYQAIRQR